MKKHRRTFKTVVGQKTYSVWVDMLRTLVPDGRTHRLAPMVAGMLRYAQTVAQAQSGDVPEEGSVAEALLDSTETSNSREAKSLLQDAVEQLFEDAAVSLGRVSSRGDAYSIADHAYEEYVRWFDMPWEG